MFVYIHTWNKATAFGHLCDESEGQKDTFIWSHYSDFACRSEVFELHLGPDLFNLLPLDGQAAQDFTVKDNLSKDHL